MDEEHVTEEDLWEELPNSTGAQRADILYRISAHLYSRNKYAEALACAQESVDILEREETTDNSSLGRSRAGVAHNLKAIGEHQAALDELIQVSELFHRESQPEVGEIDCMIGRWAYDTKDFAIAAKYLSYSTSEAGEGISDKHVAAQDMFFLGRALLQIGQADLALEKLETARESFKNLESTLDLAIADSGVAEVFVSLNRIPEAHRAAQRSLDLFTTLGKRIHSTVALMPLAQCLLLEGDFEEALKLITEAIEIEQASDESELDEIIKFERLLIEILNKLNRSEEAAEIERRHESIHEYLR